MSSVLLFATNR